MVKSGTEGIPQKMGDISSTVQSARLPREVVTGNTGLCIELSLMYASVLKAAGLQPVIFLIPGHAFPGIKTSAGYYAIEATGVGIQSQGGAMNPQQAFQRGMDELKTFFDGLQKGDYRNMIIDVNDLESMGVVPMVLGDDEFLRKKIDDIAATFSNGGGVATSNVASTNSNDTHSSTGRRSCGFSGSGFVCFCGVFCFFFLVVW